MRAAALLIVLPVTAALTVGCVETEGARRDGSAAKRWTYQRGAPPGSFVDRGTDGFRWGAPAWTAATAASFDRQEFLAEQREALASDPASADTQHRVGEALVLYGEADEGLAALKRAVDLDPDDPRWTLGYAAACAHLDRLDASRTALQACRARQPEVQELAVSEARVCEAQGDWEAAAELYAAASAIGANDQSARHWRRQQARCLYHGGDFAASRAVYAECLDPSDATATIGQLTEFGDACLRTDDHETAQILFDAVSRRSPSRIRSVEVLRGTCALHRGDLATAQTVTAAALAAWPGDPQLVHLDQLIRNAASADAPGRSPSESPEHAPGAIPFDEVDPPKSMTPAPRSTRAPVGG